MQFEVRRLDRRLPALQVVGGCHHIANAFSQASGDDARVLQLSESDGDVNVLRNKIEE